jgi:FkbM family methyltransferase
MKAGKLRQKAINAIRLLEKPKFIALRNKKINIDIYETLDQPWIHDLQIITVLDIGANTGQFALALNAVLPNSKIYSFEPIPECFEVLQKSIQGISNMQAFNTAIGNQSGKLSFERCKSSLSSSFRKMTDVHKIAFPETSEHETINVAIEKLDYLASQLEIVEPLLIKIDVQGFEDQVLRGGHETIKKAKIIIIETSFAKLYEDQPLFREIYEILLNFGFNYGGTLEKLQDPITGRVLQEDSIFFKEL